MKKSIFTVFLVTQFLLAVNITDLEYFVDTDPGFGNGTQMDITPGQSIAESFILDLSSVSVGFHTLHFRVKDEDGVWSLTSSQPFYKSAVIENPVDVPVTEAEYFIDDDPGFGNGTSVDITASHLLTEEFMLDISSVSDGFHNLQVRVKDENGSWSLANSKPFYKAAETAGSLELAISGLEYFFDVDPGLGNGSSVFFSAGHEISEAFVPDLGDITDGFHTLFVRMVDEEGVWSITGVQPFYKQHEIPSQGNLPIAGIEYFIDNDPGFGSGIQIPVTSDSQIEASFVLDLTDVPEGFHNIHARTLDASGNWSMTGSAPFFLDEVQPVENIVSLNYYFSDESGVIASHSFNGFAQAADVGFDWDVDLSGLQMGGLYSMGVVANTASGLASLRYFHEFEIDTLDCAGVLGGEAVVDDCGVCSGGTTGHVANIDMDCSGTCFGAAVIDDCNECSAGNTGLAENWAMDCLGTCFGDAILDCSGVCEGGAVFDVCGICSGGATGIEANECPGIMIDGMCSEGWSGPDFDGCGVCFGEDIVDECGECNGNGWDMCDDDANGVPNIEQYGHGAYNITVADVPADQGGWVTVNFHRSYYDTDTLAVRVPEAYYIQLYDEDWITVASASATADEYYTVLAHTFRDSVSTDNGITAFRIIASMEEGDFESIEIAFGYSIDNLTPSVPGGVLASVLADNAVVDLTWDEIADEDFQYYSIYRNDQFLGYSIEGYFRDAWPTFGEITYYVTATDTHENESGPSDPATAILGIMGDVDFSLQVDVQDIVQLVGIILGLAPTPYQFWAGDINQDTILNVMDVVLIVDIILNPGLVKGQPLTNAEIAIGNGLLKIVPEGSLAGFQFEMTGVGDIRQIELPGGWEVHYQNGILLAFDLQGNGDSDSEPLTIHYTGDLNIKTGIAVDWYGNIVSPQIEVLPDRYGLNSAYPNPFNPVTTIGFSLPTDTYTEILVYDIMGRKITKLVSGNVSAGFHEISWDARSASSGTYLIKMTAGNFSDTKTVQLIK
ncbi:MAG: T9SS type A sorting domain-containing protein [FCB group bacterium]|nr:T9SS type A sorting domain-containing protein [FCB group bacterium]